MSLSAGTRLGPYEITAPIGTGGMGEVYKAKDTRLDRSVAIKVLPAEVGADPDRRARFDREAKTIAGLNHPHICTLYDVGEADPSRGSGQAALYLVMEHLTGETLAQRLEKGPLPLEQALTVATHIADALTAAHRQGVVHRDLKPGNVMLAKAGAKLLDFGLAKLTGHGEQPAAAQLASATTQRTPLTAEGLIVGTLPYMAPEQVEGKPADARTDLWALGAILYEMLTGKRAFQGTSAASLIGAILEREPPALSTLQPVTPPSVDRLVRKCLAKDPDARWQAASDVADELRWLASGSGTTRAVGALAGVTPRPRRILSLVAGAVALVAIVGAAVGLTWWLVRPAPVVQRAIMEIQPADALIGAANSATPAAVWVSRNRPHQQVLALTSDGRVVFVGREGGRSQLYVRDVWGREMAKAIPDTVGASAPFLSPDGRWVGFQVAAVKPATGSVLKKVPLDGGGPATRICDTVLAPVGASWGDDGYIVFAAGPTSGLSRVSSDGGETTVLTKLRPDEYSHRLPHVLPGSQAILFTVVEQPWNWETARVVVYQVETKKWTEVVRGAADARYLRTGHLIYFKRGRMMAAPFDPRRLKLLGGEVGLEADIMQATNGVNSGNDTGVAQVAVSATGTLAYVAGGEVPDVPRQLIWVDRRGHVEKLDLPSRSYYVPRLSPDGRRIAVHTHQSERRIWVHDLGMPDSLVGVTPPEYAARSAVWMDDQHLAFAASPGGRAGLYLTRADGSQQQHPDPLVAPLEGGRLQVEGLTSRTPDGQLLFVALGDATQQDVWLASRSGSIWSAKPKFAEPYPEMYPNLSPDGRWLAYVTDESSGGGQLFLRPFPSLTNRRPVAGPHAVSPVWARDGKELFYILREGDGPYNLVAHSIGPDGEVAPRGMVLFDLNSRNLIPYTPVHGFDVSADGQRFLFTQQSDAPPPPPPNQIHIVENWFEELKAKFEELKAKVPPGR